MPHCVLAAPTSRGPLLPAAVLDTSRRNDSLKVCAAQRLENIGPLQHRALYHRGGERGSLQVRIQVT